jgi:hypothetical protein
MLKYADSYRDAGIKNGESRAFIGMYNLLHVNGIHLLFWDAIPEELLKVAAKFNNSDEKEANEKAACLFEAFALYKQIAAAHPKLIVE